MQYKFIYDDRTGREDHYTAEIYENDFERRIGVKENDKTKCYVLDSKGKLTITLDTKRTIELDYEEAQYILMGLLAEAHDVGVELGVENV